MPLRPLTEADLPIVLAWRNAPEVRRNMFTGHEISEAEHRAWFDRVSRDPQSRWFIYEDTHGKPQGVVSFAQLRAENKSAFWGFYSGTSSKRGTGTKMGLDALDRAFGEMRLHKLNAEVVCGNDPSISFHKKLGFSQEGLFRDYHFDGEKYVDVVRLGILAAEWASKRDEIQARIIRLDTLAQSNRAGGGDIKS